VRNPKRKPGPTDGHIVVGLRCLWVHVRQYRLEIAACIAIGIIGSLLGAVEPLVVRYVVDLLVRTGARPAALSAGLHKLFLAGAVFVAANLLQQVATTGLGLLLNRVRFGTSFRLSRKVLDHLYEQPLSFHQSHGVGYVMTRVDRGIAAVGQLVGDVLQNVVPNVANLIVIVVMLIKLCPRLAWLVLLPLPIYLLVSLRGTRELVREEETIQEGWSQLYRRVYEVLAAIKTVRSMTREGAEMQRYDQHARQLFRRLWRVVWSESAYNGARSLLALAARAAVLIYGAVLVLRGGLTPGTWLAVVGYAGMIFGPLAGLAGIYSNVSKELVAALPPLDFLQRDSTTKDLFGSVPMPLVEGTVEFDRVSYEYAFEEPDRPGVLVRKPVLHDVSFRAEAGELVALVGPSGGGKSTLIDLLLRFDFPNAGAIRIDGHDTRHVTQASLRQQMAVVLQEPVLLDGTVEENIAYGVSGTTREEVERAAIAAYADEFIRAMPEGYATRIGERGARLSGGQKQRLAIARALLRNPRILVLDEATSQLDSGSEREVQSALQNLTRGRTTFVAAHRLSTIARADRILVIEDGRIVENGGHADLVRLGGLYARLVHTQRHSLDVPPSPALIPDGAAAAATSGA
jgi:ATP-binding cassette subfamily B protein